MANAYFSVPVFVLGVLRGLFSVGQQRHGGQWRPQPGTVHDCGRTSRLEGTGLTPL